MLPDPAFAHHLSSALSPEGLSYIWCITRRAAWPPREASQSQRKVLRLVTLGEAKGGALKGAGVVTDVAGAQGRFI